MFAQNLLLLFAVSFMVDAAAIAPANALHNPISQPTCGCTETITQYITQALLPRQQCDPPVTVTHYQAPPLATIVSEDPVALSSYLSYASQLDSLAHMLSSQDRPTGEPPETTPIYYTHTAVGPAIIGTDDPSDSSVLYHAIGVTSAPIATVTNSFPAEVTPAIRLNGTSWKGGRTITVTVTAAPTETPSIRRDVEEVVTCYMIFAYIGGEWSHWCNEWDGHTTVKHTTYDTTVLVTNPPGGTPIPESVWGPLKASLDSSATIQTSPPEEPTTTAQVSPTPVSPIPASSTSSLSTEGDPTVTGIPVVVTVTVTFPVSTVPVPAVQTSSTSVTQIVSQSSSASTNQPPQASSTCGQVGQFTISFDDLPEFSTSNPDNVTTSPPIFAPYGHLYWSDGYGYGPPPNDPFLPQDGDRLAQYNPDSESTSTYRSLQGRDLPGSFGAGPRSFNSIFWFDAKSVFIGCNATESTDPCYVYLTGYRWVPSNSLNATKYDGREVIAFTEQYSPDPCTAEPCSLTQIRFDSGKFSGLSTLNIAAKLGNLNTGFYIDAFKGAWTNSTCAAGLERSTSRK